MIVVRINQLAEQLGVHRNTIRNWIKSGRLPARSVSGKRYLITEEDFSRMCRELGVSRAAVSMKQASAGPVLEREFGAVDVDLKQVGVRSERLRQNPQWGDVCLTCGSCASACPISGVDGLDPRKAIRMVVLGLEDDLIESQWPWKCTLCGKCEEACPMNVEIVAMLRRVRGLRDRDRVPSPLHKGVLMCLNRGNNLGIPKEDFLFLLEDMSQEMVEEGFPGFKVPVDEKGADILMTINSKEPFGEPEDMKFWWKIFYAAKESWTVPSEHWEGVNWGLFTGDDESLKTVVGRIVANMYRLGCKTLLLPE
jgi:excisionase family DNA binding protein